MAFNKGLQLEIIKTMIWFMETDLLGGGIISDGTIEMFKTQGYEQYIDSINRINVEVNGNKKHELYQSLIRKLSTIEHEK